MTQTPIGNIVYEIDDGDSSNNYQLHDVTGTNYNYNYNNDDDDKLYVNRNLFAIGHSLENDNDDDDDSRSDDTGVTVTDDDDNDDETQPQPINYHRQLFNNIIDRTDVGSTPSKEINGVKEKQKQQHRQSHSRQKQKQQHDKYGTEVQQRQRQRHQTSHVTATDKLINRQMTHKNWGKWRKLKISFIFNVRRISNGNVMHGWRENDIVYVCVCVFMYI